MADVEWDGEVGSVPASDNAQLEALFSRRLDDGQGSADAVYGALRQAVIERILEPGRRLTEDELARVFGVSRTPVREAVLRMEADRFIDRLGRRGLLISVMSPVEVIQIYEVRQVLDGLAAELAATHATPPGIAQLKWINQRMEAAGQDEDHETLTALSYEFHEQVAELSRNAYLLLQIREVQDRTRRTPASTMQHPGRWPEVVKEHELVISRIAEGDSEGARIAAVGHMGHARRVRLAMYGSNESPPDD